jgi:hypothetical protein
LQGSSSTSSSLQISEPGPLDLNSGEIEEEEEEDYYVEDDCDDDGDGYDEDDYEFDEADFNQHLADKFDDLDLPPGVEATVPWLQKIAAKEEVEEPSKSNNADENADKSSSSSLTLFIISLTTILLKILRERCHAQLVVALDFVLLLGTYLFLHVNIVSASQSLVKESST